MRALFGGELEEDLLAFRVFEPLAVAFEELVRSALALDADEQRLLIVDAAAQLVGALGEEPARRALEEQERRPRFEQRILRHQLRIALLERAQVIALLGGQPLEHVAAPRVGRQARRAEVELEAAALGGDRDAQRVAREDELGHRAVQCRRPVLPVRHSSQVPKICSTVWSAAKLRAAATSSMKRLDVGAQELGRAVTHVADEVKVAWMAIGRLEARPAFAEIDLARHARPDHPLQRAVDGRPPNPGILAAGRGRTDRPR